MVMATRVQTLSQGDQRLRTSVLFAVAVHSLYIVFLTVFVFKHADPMGDGMEMVVISATIMFIYLPFSLPAFLLAKTRRWLVFAAILAAVASVLYFLFWLEILDEMSIQTAPWNLG
jgi:hypothetical protein